MTMILSGSGTIGGLVAGGLPDASVTAADLVSGAARTNFGAGAVLQVVTASSTTQVTTTSNTFVTSGFSASITPTSASSKVLVMVSAMMYSNTTAAEPQIAIYRNGSSLGTFTDLFSSAGPIIAGASCTHLDSPSSTSATTYTLYFRQGNTGSGGTAYIGPNGTTFSITLLEIAA